MKISLPINTPGAWNLGSGPDRNLRGYTYTDRPVYRPGDTVHFKTIIRAENPAGYTLPQDRQRRALSCAIRIPISPSGTTRAKLNDYGSAHWEYTIPADAHLGTTTCRCRWASATSKACKLLGAGLQEARVCGEGHGADAARAARPAHQSDYRRALLLRRAGGKRQSEVGGAHLAVLSAGRWSSEEMTPATKAR